MWATAYRKQANEVTRHLVESSGVSPVGTQTRVQGVLGMLGARPRNASDPAQRSAAAQKIRDLRTIGSNQGAIHGITEGATRQNPAKMDQAVRGTVQTWNKINPPVSSPTPSPVQMNTPINQQATQSLSHLPMISKPTNVGFKKMAWATLYLKAR